MNLTTFGKFNLVRNSFLISSRYPQAIKLLKMSSLSQMELLKEKAANAAVDNHIESGQIVGIGSGSTIVYAVKRLANRVKTQGLQIKCIPTSFQARQLILQHGLTLTDLECDPQCCITIDGCDEADHQLTLIKGGGGCLAQEKVVAAYSKNFVVIADSRKNSQFLGTSYNFVPIEVLPLAYKPVMLQIQKKLGGKVNLRMAKAKAGPVVTDNGNFILDWYFKDGRSDDEVKAIQWSDVNQKLLNFAGVVETGIFVAMAKTAYFGMDDGSIKKVQTH